MQCLSVKIVTEKEEIMKIYYCLLIVICVLFSCNEKKADKLLEIPVDTDRNSSLPLSEITENITAIELELTDKSLVNPDQIKRILFSEDDVIVTELNKILIFNKEGKFIRSIASRGEGLGEYNYIINSALDLKNKRLFVLNSAPSKIICYDLEGKFLKEKSDLMFPFDDLTYVNNQLLLVGQQSGKDEVKGLYSHSALYRMDDDFQITDSCTIRNTFLEKSNYENRRLLSILYSNRDFIINENGSVYLFYGDFYEDFDNSVDRVLCDTLYRFKDNHLVPELKLKFQNENTNEFIHLFNIYRSSRYVFSYYMNKEDKNFYDFCYDTKTGKGYHMQDGYTDDINQIKTREKIRLRPSVLDPESFYYLHARMKTGDLEEPNPTLYIGKLKK
jgi:hypothetical protein